MSAPVTKTEQADTLEELLLFVQQRKALTHVEAAQRFPHPLLAEAIQGRYVRMAATDLGDIVHLGLRGRKKVGLAGLYQPSAAALMNAVALARVQDHLHKQGYQTGECHRRYMLRASRPGECFVFGARYTGYDPATLRRFSETVFPEPYLRIYVGAPQYAGLQHFHQPHAQTKITVQVIP